MRWYVKLLPFFIVCWLARRHCSVIKVHDWTYAFLSGPGTRSKPEPVILIEIDTTKRPDWFAND